MVALAVDRSADIRVFPRQLQFINDPSRFPGYVGGIGSGKTFAGAVKVISRLDRKGIGMVAAPTYSMLRDATARTLFSLMNDAGIGYDYRRGDNALTIPASGHEIIFRSLDDPEKVRGPNLDWAWVDESSLVARLAWQIVKGRVRVGPMPQAWATFTPKGRNWCWEEWERDANPDHPLYRVRTEENPELPEGFGQSLGYTGVFADQELGGEFVAFEGLVYPGFTRSGNVCVVACDDWRATLGVDIGTRNPTAILTVRGQGETKHVEHEVYRGGMSSEEITEAIEAEADRVKPEVIWLDPSAAGYISTLKRHGYPARKAKNEIKFGIGAVSTAIADGLTIDPSCVNLIAELESYHYPENRQNDDVPVKEMDHACFVAGTQILTPYGRRLIERIRPGDLVVTRQGSRRVLSAGCTTESARVYAVKMSNGHVLRGTGNHPVWVDGRGWARLDTLRYGDILHAWNRRPSSSTESFSGATQIRRAGLIESITRRMARTAEMALGVFTKKSGRKATATFPMDLKSTIGTLMGSITSCQILIACRLLSIDDCMRNVHQRDLARRKPLRILRRFARLPWNGIAQKRGAPGTRSMGETHGPSALPLLGNVSIVAASLIQSHIALATAFAPTPASRHGVERRGWMTSSEPVLTAELRSRQVGSSQPSAVPVSVLTVSAEAERQAVYNLSVEHTQEYFANGVLVHNCDALRYNIASEAKRPSGQLVYI